MASSSVTSTHGFYSSWTKKENKKFEEALAFFDEDTPDRFEKVARAVGGGKTAEEARRLYELLVRDVRKIEAGQVQIPLYKNAGCNGRGYADQQRNRGVNKELSRSFWRGLQLLLVKRG
ncbi:hypothetical protein Csa_000871 [Cucumis sativus]|nr:hypothetical protein Csa_000871 [Cucumis sativus]